MEEQLAKIHKSPPLDANLSMAIMDASLPSMEDGEIREEEDGEKDDAKGDETLTEEPTSDKNGPNDVDEVPENLEHAGDKTGTEPKEEINENPLNATGEYRVF